jgi:hypothetical protein
MFKTLFYTLPLLVASTTVTAQCVNNACTEANRDYKSCKKSVETQEELKTCLCTQKFLVNYDRCLRGVICAWDGDPTHSITTCPAVVCIGTFNGSFDAKAFCAIGTSRAFLIVDLPLIPFPYSFFRFCQVN